MTATPTQARSQRSILLFWAPLAATWVMMASEGPFLAAVIARLPDPTFNLAAHGVAFAIAILIEAPVMMLLSAATSLVRDRDSFLRLRRFSRVLCLGTTLGVVVVLIPPIYDLVLIDVMGAPPEVADLTHGALVFFLPWPAAIGYRRFLQGVLVRAGKTRLVAYGTVIRLVGMAIAALVGYAWLDMPGAWVGALSLATGVLCEAVAARWMAAGTIRSILDGKWERGGTRAFTQREIAKFYLPLALTSLIGLAVQPLLTLFMARSVSPVESLAVYPVVHALSFFFRSFGLAFQDAAIALMGERFEHFAEIRRFAVGLGAATVAGFALVTFTPLSDVYFVTLSALGPDLVGYAVSASRIIVLLPALSVLLSVQRAVLVESRRTHHITGASAFEIATVAATFTALGWGLDLAGATAAFASFFAGRVAANGYLLYRCRGLVRSAQSVGTVERAPLAREHA